MDDARRRCHLRRAVVRDGYIWCPVSWVKLGRAAETGTAHGIYLWCKRCKTEHEVDRDPQRIANESPAERDSFGGEPESR